MPAATFPPEFHPLKQQTNRAVLDVAQAAGCRVLLLGGYVRDALLGRYSHEHPPTDFDYVVMSGKAFAFGSQVASALDGVFVPLDEQLDTCRVVLSSGVQIDFAGCMGADLDADLRRRDLTINALAWDCERPDEVIDEVGGLADLEARRIRLISEQCLLDDPLRLLRVFRFAATLGFSIEPESLSMVKQHASAINSVAGERISYEIFRIMDSDRAGDATNQMAEAGLLEAIFPELTACRRVPQNSYHHLGLFDHSVTTLMECQNAWGDMPGWAQQSLQSSLGQNISRFAATKLAGLLHDIGKPSTWKVREDGRHTFILHDQVGAEMIAPIAHRLKWSRPVERFITSLVRWHLRPGSLYHQGPPTESAVYRFYRKLADDVPELVLLALSDFRSTRGPGLLSSRDVLENQLFELLNGYSVFIEGRKQTPKLLDGRDVMELLGIGSGPQIGELLEDLEEARSLGKIQNQEQARDFVVELYKQKYRK